MFYIGCHLSASDGFLAMGKTALSIGANTFQFFTRNPRGSKAKAIDPADVAAFLELAAEENCQVIFGCDAHDPAALLDTAMEAKARALTKEYGLTVLETVPLRNIQKLLR